MAQTPGRARVKYLYYAIFRPFTQDGFVEKQHFGE